MATTDVVEISGNGSFEIRLPGDWSNFDYSIISGPDIPQPSSNGQDENAEFINLQIAQRKGMRFPFRRSTVAVITFMVIEPRVVEYSIS